MHRTVLALSTCALGLLTLGPSAAAPAAGGSGAGVVTWGDREFERSVDLAGWLSARGASYATWADRHPGAAYRLATGGAVPTARLRTPPDATSMVHERPRTPAPPAVAHVVGEGRTTAVVPALLVSALVAAFLLAASLAPQHLAPRIRLAEIALERRSRSAGSRS